MKLEECDCKVANAASGEELNDGQIAGGFVPQQRRGFVLGHWDGVDKLPDNCEWVRFGDQVTGESFEDQHLVACDLKGKHVLAHPNDPKQACRESYGEEVVVHVMVPEVSVSCQSDDLELDNASTVCGATPWVPDFARAN